MAVFRRVYQPFEGGLSPVRSRWLVLLRYALRDVFASRIFVAFLVLCFVPTLIEATLVWLVHNPTARALLHMGTSLLVIDERFFYRVLAIQGGLALFLAAAIGPRLVAPDLADGALALYLSRPLSRTAYVAGKTGTLLLLLSAVTWLPLLALYLLQGGLEGAGGSWPTGGCPWRSSWRRRSGSRCCRSSRSRSRPGCAGAWRRRACSSPCSSSAPESARSSIRFSGPTGAAC